MITIKELKKEKMENIKEGFIHLYDGYYYCFNKKWYKAFYKSVVYGFDLSVIETDMKEIKKEIEKISKKNKRWYISNDTKLSQLEKIEIIELIKLKI